MGGLSRSVGLPRVVLPEGYELPHHDGMRLFCFALVWAMTHRPVRRGARTSDWVRVKRVNRGTAAKPEWAWQAKLGPTDPADESTACPYRVANNIPDHLMLLLLQGKYVERRPQKGVHPLDLERPWMHLRATDAVRAAVLVVEES